MESSHPSLVKKWEIRAILGCVLGNTDSGSNSARNGCDLAHNSISEPQFSYP